MVIPLDSDFALPMVSMSVPKDCSFTLNMKVLIPLINHGHAAWPLSIVQVKIEKWQ